jgi:hypothetical protein
MNQMAEKNDEQELSEIAKLRNTNCGAEGNAGGGS